MDQLTSSSVNEDGDEREIEASQLPSTTTNDSDPPLQQEEAISSAAADFRDAASNSVAAKWQLDQVFESIVFTSAPANDFEAAISFSNDEALQALVKKLRVECRGIVKDRYYQ